MNERIERVRFTHSGEASGTFLTFLTSFTFLPSGVIVGIDEAGRGALAGPVVAGACVFNPRRRNVPIADSKQLTPEQRERSFAWITKHCICGVGIVSAEFIDNFGILVATERAMQLAVIDLKRFIQPTHLLVDGRDKFHFDEPHSSIIRGDQKERCISAASIIAKVTRDRIMVEYSRQFPHYFFNQHKGYGTRKHYDAIQKDGLCELHRRSFIMLTYCEKN